MVDSEDSRHRLFLCAFSAHEPALRAFVRRLVPSRMDADDVLQDVAVVLWTKFDSFREGADFRAWAFGIARFEVLAWFRDRGRDRLVLDETVVSLIAEEPGLDEPGLSRHLRALEECLRKMDDGQRDLLMRAYRPGSRIQDLAGASGRSVAGFYQWLHRVRRQLSDCIQTRLAGEGS